MKKCCVIVAIMVAFSLLITKSVFANDIASGYSLSNDQIREIYCDLGMSPSFNKNLEVIAISSRDYSNDVKMVCYRLNNGIEIAVEYYGSTNMVTGIYDKENGELKILDYNNGLGVRTISFERYNQPLFDNDSDKTDNKFDNTRGQVNPDLNETSGAITFASLNSSNELVQTTINVSGDSIIVFSNHLFRINGTFQNLIELAGVIADILGGSIFFGNDIASQLCELFILGLSNITVDSYVNGSKIVNNWNTYIEGTNASAAFSGYYLYGHVQGSNQFYYDYSSDYYYIDSLRDHYLAFANRVFRSIFYFNNTSNPINWNIYY